MKWYQGLLACLVCLCVSIAQAHSWPQFPKGTPEVDQIAAISKANDVIGREVAETLLAQGGRLAPWAGGSMPPIGSSFGYRGSMGGYGQPYYYDSQPIIRHSYVNGHGWTTVPQRQPQRYIRQRTITIEHDRPVIYGWSMRIGCLGEVYYVWERQGCVW